jgi:hypothetical protein
MIIEQGDVNVLEKMYTLLQKTSLNLVLKTKLTHRAKQAEEGILSGRLYTKNVAIYQNNQIGKEVNHLRIIKKSL